ncbi:MULTISPECIES: hypothetical protein [unclassified Frigoribacterium]|uniref:hypothetical protein n=1 Tax=unclassified Frigoribacterium TaxID=2627005 RepID=UPI0006F54E6B|nr:MULTISPECIES: hypothetical protein [unclassified Frigoribacterium]KQO84625.1 hypothetical protein ASF17_03890 [Frigoribacterium sp. Leaf263]KQR63972.1 hypothetical protein ASF89_12890 [Frigoribacterium sp. Leaf172]
MNNTNRALNRLLVFVIGLVLLAGGAAVAVGALWPDVRDTVSGAASDASGPVSDALSGDQVWILWVVAAASLVLILLLVWFAFRQGHGQTGELLTVDEGSSRNEPTGGRLVIDAKVAEQVLEEALADTAGIVSIDVTAFRVKGENVLRITANARKGASPVEIRRSIDQAVSRWDALLGTETPVVVQINGGLRTQMASATRLD